jgi:Ni/Co efflux regulator RcnB
MTSASVAVGLAFSGPLLHGQRDRDRDRHDHDRFDDRDRQVARDWYRDHHDAFRHDEGRYWHREWEPNIREGYVLTPEMRAGIRPVPRDLRLPPPPPGYRYVMIGDHIVLVDRGYRIHDVLHFELNF